MRILTFKKNQCGKKYILYIKHYDFFFQEAAKFTKIFPIFESILEFDGFQSPFYTILG